jgi:very-short-patch-repair endonuclease
VIRGIAVTSAERTLLDVAGARAPWVFNEALDGALRMELTSRDRLSTFLDGERRSGVHGVHRMRAALETRSVEVGITRSALEREFLSLLVEAGLPQPEINQQVTGSNGFRAVVDMVYPEHKLIIEIQSYAHHSSLEAFNRDAARLAQLTALGYRAMEVTAEQMRTHPHRTIEIVTELLEPVRRSS